jgi:putative redox protein
MKTNVKLVENMKFVATPQSGHSLVLDTIGEKGGKDSGATPMELILTGLAGCTAMDVISILRKKRENVTDFQVNIEAERTEDFPKVFKKIHIEYVVTGKDINASAVERSIELSETKYCGASAMLRKTAEITNSYKILEEDEE